MGNVSADVLISWFDSKIVMARYTGRVLRAFRCGHERTADV